MIGVIHKAIADFVKYNSGEEAWTKVLEEAGLNELNEMNNFQQNCIYPDGVTFKLFTAVCKVLNLSLDEVLQKFGDYFFLHVRDLGFEGIFKSLGEDLLTFIQNLDSLHNLLLFTYPGIIAPSFRCECDTDTDEITLHYYSKRKGLHPIVVGIIEAVGRHLFQQRVQLTYCGCTEISCGTDDESFINHSVFKVEIFEDLKRHVRWALKNSSSTALRLKNPSSLTTTPNKTPTGTATIIRSEDLAIAVPFYILMDTELDIVECGQSIHQKAIVKIHPGTPFRDVAVICKPVIKLSAQNILSFINSIFFIALKRDPSDHLHSQITLQGQIMWLPHCCHLLFIGSPAVTTLDQLQNMHLGFYDIPLYDVTRHVIINEKPSTDTNSYGGGGILAQMDELQKELRQEKDKTEYLLSLILPPAVSTKLVDGTDAAEIPNVTVLFADVVGFTDMVMMGPPRKVIDMLNMLIGKFDSRVKQRGIYKVDTMGSSYMAVSGVPDPVKDHAYRAAELAFDICEDSRSIKTPSKQTIQLRVGMHSGSVLTGCVGDPKPRYDVFGETVVTASRIKSSGAPDRIHISEDTYFELMNDDYYFRSRGKISLREPSQSKKTYFLISSPHRKGGQMDPDDWFKTLPLVAGTTAQVKFGRCYPRSCFSFCERCTVL